MLSTTPNPILQPRRDPDTPASLPAHVMRRRAARRQMLHLLHVKNAANELRELPAKEETIHAIMRGNFHAWDLVPAVLRLASPAVIDRLSVATLGFNRQNATELLELIDQGKVKRVTFVASCYFKSACPGEFKMLADGLQARSMLIAAVRSHAKVIVMRLSDGRAIALESSANLRSCRSIEQFCMTQSVPLAEFHEQWMQEVTKRSAAR